MKLKRQDIKNKEKKWKLDERKLYVRLIQISDGEKSQNLYGF